jgi:bifunctional non-homologous end joining protein LigD
MEELVRRYSQVQLATLVDAPPEGDKWLHEIKYDGDRLLAFLEQDDVSFTPERQRLNPRFPAVRASIAQVKAHSAVLDMEPSFLNLPAALAFMPCSKPWATRATAAPSSPTSLTCCISMAEFKRSAPDRAQEPARNSVQTISGSTLLHYSEHVIGNSVAILAHMHAEMLEDKADEMHTRTSQISQMKALIMVIE